MKIGDKVKVVKVTPLMCQGLIGVTGKITREGILYSWNVKFDEPFHLDTFIWEEMPFYEKELELI